MRRQLALVGSFLLEALRPRPYSREVRRNVPQSRSAIGRLSSDGFPYRAVTIKYNEPWDELLLAQISQTCLPHLSEGHRVPGDTTMRMTFLSTTEIGMAASVLKLMGNSGACRRR
jgi:hypothetical protein